MMDCWHLSQSLLTRLLDIETYWQSLITDQKLGHLHKPAERHCPWWMVIYQIEFISHLLLDCVYVALNIWKTTLIVATCMILQVVQKPWYMNHGT